MARSDPAGSPRVAHFDRRGANAVEVGEELYIYLDADDPSLVPARCPHRGGPLHVASVEDRAHGVVLVCPWHGSAIPLRALKRRAAATVQSGDHVRAVIDVPDGAELVVRYIPVRFMTDGACAADCAGGVQKATPEP